MLYTWSGLIIKYGVNMIYVITIKIKSAFHLLQYIKILCGLLKVH